MLYHLDENQNAPSWAGSTLSMLKYNSDPKILQSFIEAVYRFGTRRIKLINSNGKDVVKVVPVALFDVLDGKNTGDYIARVEPSVEGGRKMGARLADVVWKEYPWGRE